MKFPSLYGAMQAWRLYHNPERHIHKAAWTFQNQKIKELKLKPAERQLLVQLNQESRKLKKEITDLGIHYGACRDCKGECCAGQYDHFTPVDYLLQLDSDHPLDGWGEIWKPATIPEIVLDLLRSRGENGRAAEGSTRIYSKPSRPSRCPDLGDSGCRLSPEDRPIRCVIWGCHKLRQQFSREIFLRIGRKNLALAKIVKQVVRIAQSAQVRPI